MLPKTVQAILLFLIPLAPSLAQPTFVTTYSIQAESFGKAIVSTYDGGLILGGTTITAAADTGIVLIKVDLLGNVIWSKIVQAPSDENLVGMISTSDSGLALISVSLSSRTSSLIKVDAAGAIEWSKSFYDLYPYSLIQTLDQGYCIAGGGKFPITGPSYWYSKIIKTDIHGDTLWTRTHSDGGYFFDMTQVFQNPDSTYIVAEIYSQLDIGIPWIGKVDADGHLIYKTSPDNSFDEFKDLVFCKTPGSDYLIAGEGWEDIINGYGLMKLDSQLSFKWFKLMPASVGSPTRAMLQTIDGNVLLLQEHQLVKVDTSGIVIWAQRLPGTASIGKNALVELPDGGLFFCGSTYDSTIQTHSMSLFRFDSSGFNCLSDPLAISYLDDIRPHFGDTIGNEVQFNYVIYPDSFSMAPLIVSEQTACIEYIQIGENVRTNNLVFFPSPTAGKFRIRNTEFKIERLIISNLLGEEVTVVKPHSNSDSEEAEFDISRLPCGIYFALAFFENKSWSGKLVKE